MNGYEADFKSRSTRATELRHAHNSTARVVRKLEMELDWAIKNRESASKEFQEYETETRRLADELPA